ncbi:MAG: hypothetical protein FJ030_10605 [Chloroflexi bacterium]|nr:hypothetical protein [Chloroflexota bacterium]
MSNDFDNALTPSERKLVASLTTPFKIQTFLDDVPYSGEERYRCPLTFLRDRTGHCFDGAAFAAAMLHRLGHPPLIIDLLPNRRDDDHMLAPYKHGGHWGALAKSNFSGLRFREPVFRSLRELVMSYFEDYFNAAGEKTLRAYTAPLNLNRFATWRTDDAAMDKIADRLGEIRQFQTITPQMARRLSPMDKRAYDAGLLGVNEAGLYQPPK